MELVDITESPNSKKRFRAYFNNGKHTDFGDPQMESYIQHHDKGRRYQYWQRHINDLKTNDPTRAGYLSMFILWGNSTNIETNIRSYKELFNL